MCKRRDVHYKTACCAFRSGEGCAGGVSGTGQELLVAVSWLGLSCSQGDALHNLGLEARLGMQHGAGGAALRPFCGGHCSLVVFWAGSCCILEVIEKKRIFQTFIKCVSFPPKQSVLVSLVLPVLACIPALAALRRRCCFSCSGDTILQFYYLAPGVRIRPYQKSLWICWRANKTEAKSWW